MPTWRKISRPFDANKMNSTEACQKQEGQQTSDNPEFNVDKNSPRGVMQFLRRKLSCTSVKRKVGKNNCCKTEQTECAHNLSDNNSEPHIMSVDIDSNVAEETQDDQREVQEDIETSHMQTYCRVLPDFLQPHSVYSNKILKEDHSFSQDDVDEALILACQNGHAWYVRQLLVFGANVMCRDTDGNTPLMICSKNGFVKLVQFLLTRETDLNAANAAGDTALILCLQSPGSTEIAKLLLQQKEIDITQQNGQGYTALLKAVEMSDVSTAHILLKRYFNIFSGKSNSRWKVFEKHGLGMVLEMLTEYNKHGCGFDKTSPLDMAVKACDVQALDMFLFCVHLDEEVKVMMINDAYLNFFTRYFKEFRKSQISMVKRLLELGADVQDSFSDSPALFAATKAGSWPLVELLCQHGADVKVKRKTFVSPCLPMTADRCYYNAHGQTKDGDTVALETKYCSALDYAFCFGNMKCAKALLKYGAKVDIESALLTVICYQSIEYMHFLLKNYKNKTCQFISQNKIKMFLSAVNRADIEIFMLIFEAGGGVTEKYLGVNIFLLLLSVSRNEEITRFLIQKGADVNKVIKIDGGLIPVHIYKCNRFNFQMSLLPMVQVLLENGACPNTCYNSTPVLMLAATHTVRSQDRLKLLLDHMADINLKDPNGDTALMYSAYLGHPKNAAFLISNMKESQYFLNAQSNERLTALMCAVIENNTPVMVELLKHGADVNVTDKCRNTALLHAFNDVSGNEQSFEVVVTCLFLAGCDINWQNNGGRSALMLATRGLRADAISVLLHSGSDINPVSKICNKKTALSYLRSNLYDYDTINVYLSHFLDQGGCSLDKMSTLFHRVVLKEGINKISKFIANGVGPVTVRSDKIYRWGPAAVFKASPLCTALIGGNLSLAHYFMEIMFLTKCDMSSLMYSKLVREHLKTKNYRPCLDLLDEMSSQPVSLFKLAFVTVSSAVGTSPLRVNRVNKLPLPQMMKDKLLFR